MTAATIWVDGAENYGSGDGTDITGTMLDGLWEGAQGIVLSTIAVRTGNYAFRLRDATSAMRRSLKGDQDYVKVMFSAYFPVLPGGISPQFATVQIRNFASQPIITLDVTPTGRLMWRDYTGAVIATSQREIVAGVHNHFEVNFSATAGWVHVKVNGDANFILSATGQQSGQFYSKPDSDNIGSPAEYPAAEVLWGSYSGADTPVVSQMTVDDIATFGIVSADENTYLGLYGVYWLQPTAEGHYTSWNFSTGSTGFNLVNENPPDGDATFIYTPTVNDEASYPVAPLPTNVTEVYSILPLLNGKKTDAGPGSVQFGVRSGSTDALNGADTPLLTTYSYFNAAFDTDPATSSSWSPTSLPQVLVKRTV